MGALEEIRQMQQSGMGETEIIARLQEQGVPYREISEALAQSRIKSAVEDQANNSSSVSPQPNQENEQAMMNQSDYQNSEIQPRQEAMQVQGMQPSLMQQQAQPEQQEYYPQYDQSASAPTGYEQNPQGYDYSSAALSSDTITEISEQIISEKLSDVRKKMEKLVSMKTELEAKTESIEERLKRIEKIIDSLQSSVLRKVGDYVTNVDDIKRELVETQKTIGKVLGSRHIKEEHKK